MVGIKSDVGNVRKLNEDYALYKEGDKYKIFVVADGMGGHNAGEVASEMASRKVIEFIESNFNYENRYNILKDAVEYANLKVYEFSHGEAEYRGMGTTLTACLVTKEFIQVANVGDSSCYGIKGEKLKKITRDHSLVQELLDFGSITEEEAEKHPQRNIITRAIGTKEWVEVDIFKINPDEYDLFLLCSDGLSNEVKGNDVLSILSEYSDLNKICDILVDLAKSRGGRDNITVLLFEGEV
ncbi:Stp1/IreP family PP2C-type Ser/Thr phosphatase [Clostridium septicum]|uniref:protein-serine/threonine phosphatase n=1 Tax=Clostridium septicum TaxID=1504 RepID=A0A9N7JIC2_CLOSE|nr:Stp1/IreP family PP2C-type Ser/Thr phosphatase [Clostridium septicum]AYE33119.1 serine/threonine-protein phosphatase [Clostridium septicum]MDU1313473.1 Stp1/IreP family PP2C-type Ser/Thr phosphatase [Clostridium septicum]QAS61289.1 Stp1/IreP family PP2C-type Ser/Thr phosphatase [Clostridium septicum]UEC19360.1 Stp1/IreP family PP2C-type Ser/Thr phosphatase [Clostridium septicum]USR99687.1 Stp1/IreP family PP2C-type Ser/Thr phosphatase [Clostridium septicum]